MSPGEWSATRADIETMLAGQKIDVTEGLRNVSLAIQACDKRLARLTDAYVDKLIDREIYLNRKEQFIRDRAILVERKNTLDSSHEEVRKRIEHILELVGAFRNMPDLGNDDRLRDVLARVTSNFTVNQKNVVIAWAKPFDQLVGDDVVALGGPARGKPRTASQRIVEILAEYTRKLVDANSSVPSRKAA